MLLRWLNHPSLRGDEQLIAMLYDLGISTKQQLLTITGWSSRTLRWRLQQIRERGQTPEERDMWVKAYPVPRTRHVMAYALGRLGIQYALEMRFEQSRGKEPPQSQIAHYVGTNEVLVRLLQAGVSREQVQWLSSKEATDYLVSLWEWAGKELNRRRTIRPDARLILNEQRFWIEYDNDTENPRQLERKFHDYVNTLVPVGENSPVLWIASNDQRKRYLEMNWKSFQRNFYKESKVPNMMFFTEGEETNFLLSATGKITGNISGT
ncbi:hypothetical protein DNHGIG_32430 [Collibacillus ludicampi]|uniref:Protein involved in plasmid replication-relaxation n=1 Tax=Collibacillus ludicampi TaxID=2771369 RepID=A0AAV4LJU2_9BACL|nr:replication-relaxation family protein [Collibacillus ludicampi]GIM47694.1 hypothetical protein DNHGIG_32430 [Collibacillus ludicampi]